MGRTPCCPKNVNKGAWSGEEDERLANYISIHGEGKWRIVAENAGLNRCAKSCRLRYLNYLKPGIKRGHITSDEEDMIIRLHNLLGNRWALIAGRLPGRTDNEIKNYWKTILVKKQEDQAPRSQYMKQQVASQNDKTSEDHEVGKDNSQAENIEDHQEEKVVAINYIEEPSNGDREIDLTYEQMRLKDIYDDVEDCFMNNEVEKELLELDAMQSYHLALMENENNNDDNMENENNFLRVGNESNYSQDDNLYVELQKLASFLDLEDHKREF